jgi:hypothetical protein
MAWSDVNGVRDSSSNLNTPPDMVKTAPVVPGSWSEVMWDEPFSFPDYGLRVLIGYQFVTDNYYYLHSPDCFPDSAPVPSLTAPNLFISEDYDPDTTYGSVRRAYFKIGTNNPQPTNGSRVGYGIDILVSDTSEDEVMADPKKSQADIAATALRAAGYSGTLNDMQYRYLKSLVNPAKPESIQDLKKAAGKSKNKIAYP